MARSKPRRIFDFLVREPFRGGAHPGLDEGRLPPVPWHQKAAWTGIAVVVVGLTVVTTTLVGPRHPTPVRGPVVLHPEAWRGADEGATFVLPMPDGFGLVYNGRRPHGEATLFDAQGDAWAEVSVDMPAPVRWPAEPRKLVAVLESAPDVTDVHGEDRDTPRGRVRWTRAQSRGLVPGSLFSMAPDSPEREVRHARFTCVEALAGRPLVTTFRVPVARAATLEPIAWAMVRDAKLRDR